MTEEELSEDIIVKMLEYKGLENVSIDGFCSVKKITFTSVRQKMRVFEYLENMGYIKRNLYIGSNGNFTITPLGVNYAEELLAEKGKDKNDSITNTDGKGKTTNIPEEPAEDSTSESYTTQKLDKGPTDSNIKPCFNVKSIAECYVDLIDGACKNEESNVCLFGIFAPWGRGKTYFFKKMKEYIDGRKSLKAMQYDIVEFNAWKYQETPAVWAYLFETLYNSKNWWFKFRYTIKRNIKSIGCDVLIYFIPTILTAIATLIIKCETNKDNIFIGTSIVGIISIIGLIINFISKHYNSAIKFIQKYSKGISFANELGIQAEIEKEITSLLKFWIGNKETVGKKVILYIDDIDRCSETKMTSIIDSLRTVLENEEIRKRLIIICSIDPEKILKGIEYKYKNLYDDKELRSIAIDQMDKIFLTGIALSQLDKEQLLEFASKLTEVNDNSIFKQHLQTSNGQDLITNDGQKILIENSPEIEEKMKLDDPEIYKQLKELINNNEKPLTPRKIRIIYYRIVLANNIICRKENPKITNALIQNIFNLSIGEKINHDETSNELSEVLNMVVPYRYNKENEVEEDKEGKVAS